MKEVITVFTPTYNRKNLLERCYMSLKSQTNKNFIWLIVDDGSKDNTQDLVRKWIEEEKNFKIEYIYKSNGGLHTAYNKAIEIINTELCVCIDSDDFMPSNAIELIIDFWNENRNGEYAGIIGLDFYANGELIGDILPEEYSVNLNTMLIEKIGRGDKKLVVRTELYKKVFPMKSFGKEKNFNPNYLNTLISEEYEWLVLNENLCFVEYQEEGMSNNIYKQFLDSPNSFAQTRRLYLSLKNTNFNFKLRNSIHYTSSCIIAKDYMGIVSKSPKKMYTFFAIPFSICLTLYIKKKAKIKNIKK